METLNTYHIASITELREPMKVLEAAKGQPVAILKNNRHVATLTPAQQSESRPATDLEIQQALAKTQHQDQPILAYLKSR